MGRIRRRIRTAAWLYILLCIFPTSIPCEETGESPRLFISGLFRTLYAGAPGYYLKAVHLVVVKYKASQTRR